SPIVNVRDVSSAQLSASRREIHEINLNPVRQFSFFKRLAIYFDEIAFPIKPSSSFRYCFDNDFYSYGDALVLSAMIQSMSPRRIIEVGSGYSSAVMLDTLDHLGKTTVEDCLCTFIEPYPDRLKSLLRPYDFLRVQILEVPVQQADLTIFTKLDVNDILFLDTTHVVKTGSDVVHELF